MTLQALIFDFDGLIADTESADYQAWCAVYAAYGVHLDLARWNEGIGSYDTFDPYAYLAEQLGRPVDRAAVHAEYRARMDNLIADIAPLPGVRAWIADARRLGLKLAIASSSPRHWVEGLVARLGMREPFQAICCREDVDHTKPDPALYRLALKRLNVSVQQAIALEDSPHGVRAAKAAGLYCIAVPNPMTRTLDLSNADLRLNSLADLTLEDLMAQLQTTPT